MITHRLPLERAQEGFDLMNPRRRIAEGHPEPPALRSPRSPVARLRVLGTAPIPGEALSRLRESFRVDLNRSGRKLSSREMRRRIARAHGLLCLPSDSIDRTILAAGPHLKGIANCAVGTDNIDLDRGRAARNRRHQHARRPDRGHRPTSPGRSSWP
jgi:hypothetical protein